MKRLARFLFRLLRPRADTIPNLVIGPRDNPYMHRWYIIPRNPIFNIYFHHVMRSDDDFALHDHPWVNLSFLLVGGYIEHTILAGGIHQRTPRFAGDLKLRGALAAHRLEIVEGIDCWTLFITGPKLRKWGFHCPNGWRAFDSFIDVDARADGNSLKAQGCGEPQ